jgi:hypothetical protein
MRIFSTFIVGMVFATSPALAETVYEDSNYYDGLGQCGTTISKDGWDDLSIQVTCSLSAGGIASRVCSGGEDINGMFVCSSDNSGQETVYGANDAVNFMLNDINRYR